MSETKVKFLKELTGIIDGDMDEGEDERTFGFTVYECCSCHWRFIGDCDRTGYGYDWQGVQTPNYCPMCGRKISDEMED